MIPPLHLAVSQSGLAGLPPANSCLKSYQLDILHRYLFQTPKAVLKEMGPLMKETGLAHPTPRGKVMPF